MADVATLVFIGFLVAFILIIGVGGFLKEKNSSSNVKGGLIYRSY